MKLMKKLLLHYSNVIFASVCFSASLLNMPRLLSYEFYSDDKEYKFIVINGFQNNSTAVCIRFKREVLADKTNTYALEESFPIYSDFVPNEIINHKDLVIVVGDYYLDFRTDSVVLGIYSRTGRLLKSYTAADIMSESEFTMARFFNYQYYDGLIYNVTIDHVAGVVNFNVRQLRENIPSPRPGSIKKSIPFHAHHDNKRQEK